MKWTVLTLAFGFELAVLGLTGVWAWEASPGWLTPFVPAVGLPLVLAVLWGVFASPKARFPVRGAVRWVFESLWFGAGGLALAGLGFPWWGVAFWLLWLANTLARGTLDPGK